jgi:DNA-damage-inducible protein D
MEGQPIEIVLRGKVIETDTAGNVCLNDLWKLAGEPANRRARDWYPSKRAKALDAALRIRIGENFPNSKKIDEKTTYYVEGRGVKARTFAHPVLALDYAEFLNADLGVEIRETFLRVRARDVTLALEIVEGMAEQAEYDGLRVKLRQLVKEHNKMSVGVAQEAGVRNFEAYNGAGLAGLYGDMTKADLLKKKGLDEDADRLAHAGHEELAANYFKATQAIAKLQRDKIKGQKAANDAHYQVGAAVRSTIKDLGGTMPEDEPTLEHIKEAEKRLKKAEKADKDRLIDAAGHDAGDAEHKSEGSATAKPNVKDKPKKDDR